MLLTTKVLLTLLTLGYSAIPAMFDFNQSHAANPLWTGHARFHCVWQVTSYVLLALMLLAVIWLPILPGQTGLILPLLAAIAIYCGFFTAVFAKSRYGGANHDENGYLPLHGPFGIMVDVNITIFSTMAVLVLITVVLMSQVLTAAV